MLTAMVTIHSGKSTECVQMFSAGSVVGNRKHNIYIIHIRRKGLSTEECCVYLTKCS
jgi:hypothetical protein